MGIYSDVFNRTMLYHTFFFTVNSVLEHKDLSTLKKEKPRLHDTWINLSKDAAIKQDLSNEEYYLRYAPYYPEYSKIVCATCAVVAFNSETGKLKKDMKRVLNNKEKVVLEQFFDLLYVLSSDGSMSNPKDFKTLGGFNITFNDIPLLIKRFFKYSEEFKEDKGVPLILKNTLDLKPWDDGVVDLAHVWNFKGRNVYSLELIADFLGIKKPVDFLSQHELSKKYWELMNEDNEKEALKMVAEQGTLNLNTIIHAFNKLRKY